MVVCRRCAAAGVLLHEELVSSTLFLASLVCVLGFPHLFSLKHRLDFSPQDQRAAMAWVRRNAAQLGADASRLMIFGESAGVPQADRLEGQAEWHVLIRVAHLFDTCCSFV